MGRGGARQLSSLRKRPWKSVLLSKVASRKTVCLRAPPPPVPPIVIAGEALPDNNGSAHDAKVPRIRALSVTWDLLSTVVLTGFSPALPYIAGVEDMGFGRYHRRQQLDHTAVVRSAFKVVRLFAP